jgi:hypothetical protein
LKIKESGHILSPGNTLSLRAENSSKFKVLSSKFSYYRKLRIMG